MAPEVLPAETTIPDVIPQVRELMRKARKWADVPHRYFVDEFVHQARTIGEVDSNEVWAIYEVLQKAEKRGPKELPRVTDPHPTPGPTKR